MIRPEDKKAIEELAKRAASMPLGEALGFMAYLFPARLREMAAGYTHEEAAYLTMRDYADEVYRVYVEEGHD